MTCFTNDELEIIAKALDEGRGIKGNKEEQEKGEPLKITIDDVEDKDSIIIIRIPDSKTHTSRCFVISSQDQMKI
ncbi:hypothetical protein NQ317_001997 [Molorchus minor]|uniref:Uncharacterized protein n=1 Tax=Molorchus minor TaxID=1323400 RepID=A0ABQ9J1H2_9CUCU|nr:hypothetical protein NQ317_001997 [Molorchus minor]